MTWHPLGLLPVVILAAVAWARFGWRGLALPVLIVLTGQVEYDLFINVYASAGYFSWFDIGLPAAAILYARWFAFPAFTIATFITLWLWAMATGGVTDLAAVVGWWFVSAQIMVDNL